MTNAQKWVAVFLVLFIALFMLQRITKNEDEILDEYDYYDESSSEINEMDGLALMNKIGCVSCHGSDLKGTSLGPSLYSAKDYWTRKQLIGYLRNPSSYDGDERFETYKSQYKALMPSYNNIEVDKLGVIADYLMSLEESNN